MLEGFFEESDDDESEAGEEFVVNDEVVVVVVVEVYWVGLSCWIFFEESSYFCFLVDFSVLIELLGFEVGDDGTLEDGPFADDGEAGGDWTGGAAWPGGV